MEASGSIAKDYGSWPLKNLKEELKRRNAKTTGKKAALVQRLMVYDIIFGGLVNDPEETYQIPMPNPDLFRDVTSESTLPKMSEKDLQQYSVLAERENVQTSKNMYNERYLQTTRVAYSGGAYYITALCSSEMRKSVTYKVTIKATDNCIIESQCECAAGMGPHAQCKHVMVLLCGVIEFETNKEIKRSVSCTSTLQSFHCPASTFTGNPVQGKGLTLKHKNAKALACFEPRPKSSITNPNRIPKYKENFISNTVNSCSLENLKMPVLQHRDTANKRALFAAHDYMEKTEEERFFDSLILDTSEMEELEKKTRYSNKMWRVQRKFRLQSSDFGKICKCSEINHEKLAKRLLKGEEIKTTDWSYSEGIGDSCASRYATLGVHTRWHRGRRRIGGSEVPIHCNTIFIFVRPKWTL